MTEPERFELLPPLDQRPGPARKLADARAAELVRGALDAVLLDAAGDARDDATAVDLVAQASAMNAAPVLAGRPVAAARRPSRGRFVLVACLGILIAGIASA